jgi:dolichol-phosphate mannosyltransferase
MLSVVVPVHDEERSVALLYDELQAALEPLDTEWEAVFVDDGSTDGTFAALTRLHAGTPNVRVVRLRRNFGKAAALGAGFDQARGEIVVTIDGDLQDDPFEIPRLLAKLEEGFDLVSGWKAHRRDPISRRVLSRIFNSVTSRFSGVRLHDMNCGLKAYRAEVVHGVRLYGELHRFIPVLAHYRGFRIAELPVNHRPREHGRSRYGIERYLRGFLDLLTVSFIGRYRHRPLHLFGGLGLALGLLGIGILVYLTVVKALGHAIGGRPLLLLGVLLVVVGMQFFSLGLISEMITSHHEERAQERERAEALGTALRLAVAEARLLPKRVAGGAVIVGYPGHFDLPAARRAARGRPVIFNPLLSLADTIVSDRGRFRVGSPASRALAAIDRRAFATADMVVADTEAHAEFLSHVAGHDRFEVCFVGAEERLFRPPWAPADAFSVLFVGKLIPLQGVHTIIEAARLTPKIRFRLVGTGQLESLLATAPPNVERVPWIEYELLPRELRRAGCALGIFGTTPKAGRVIPNKAFQALACGTPLVTGDTPAARELLTDEESALLVPPGDAQALAGAVRRLAENRDLGRLIGVRGRAVYEARASEAVLGPRWRGLIERAIAAKS